jgi:hypothetical protein
MEHRESNTSHAHYRSTPMKIAIVMALLLSLVAALAACDEEPIYRDLIDRASTTSLEARSFRTTVNLIMLIDSHVYSKSSESEFVAPDRWHSVYTAIVDGGGDERAGVGQDTESRCPGAWSETIVVANVGYVRTSEKPEWTVIPGWSMAQPMEKRFERYKFLVDVEKLPDEEIRGANCSHYHGRVDQDAYVDMMEEEIEGYGEQDPEYSQVLESTRGDERFADLWIDENDYIRQIKEEARFLDPSGNRLTSFTISRYFDYNEDIDISAPPGVPVPTPRLVLPWSSPTISSWPTPTPTPPHCPPSWTPPGTT